MNTDRGRGIKSHGAFIMLVAPLKKKGMTYPEITKEISNFLKENKLDNDFVEFSKKVNRGRKKW